MSPSNAGTMKPSLASALPRIVPPKISRKRLRKYSWLPDVFRLKGSIVGRIFGPVLTVTLFTSLIAYASSKGYNIVLTNSVVPLLSVVVGLILVFRNSTSYDRYWEGRKSFATMVSNIRNLTRQIWIMVALPPVPVDGSRGKILDATVTEHQLRKRKVEAIHLTLSFAFAIRHYLRGEDGVNYPDYASILPASFARFDENGYTTIKATAASSYAATQDGSNSHSGRDSPRETIRTRPEHDATKRVRAKRSKVHVLDPMMPLLDGTHHTVEFRAYADDASLPLPLIIAHELVYMIFQFRKEGFLEAIGPAGMNAMIQLVQSMVDQLSAMERIANTPIPVSYGIHLKQCVTLYLFALPMTLVHDLGWATIPIVTVIAFTLMGIEGIADEIEMPFGTDDCDLPLDRYCQDLKEEILYTLDRLPQGGEGLHAYDDGEGDD